MKKITIVLMFISSFCFGQTTKEIFQEFPTIDFNYFSKDTTYSLYKDQKSIVMVGKLGDSVLVCYITKKKISSVCVSTRYRYKDTEIQGQLYSSKNKMIWPIVTPKYIVGYMYLGNIKEIELNTQNYLYEVVLLEYTQRNNFVLVDVIQY